jgi:hypothetical protein
MHRDAGCHSHNQLAVAATRLHDFHLAQGEPEAEGRTSPAVSASRRRSLFPVIRVLSFGEDNVAAYVNSHAPLPTGYYY